MLRVALFGFVFASAVSSAPVPKALKAKRPNLNGEWVAFDFWCGEENVLESNPWVWVIDGEELTALNRPPVGPVRPVTAGATFQLLFPSGERADAIDYRCHGPGYDVTSRGLFALDGDELTICWNASEGERPTQLARSATVNFIRFKRAEAK